ncbi:glycosyltransferase family 4 protein [Aestuariivita boseongensis]|uniref:glycosyltransferase family 4 protein n=1 Tax=Aestuariivita boseongensis TaxID=1470562 RepID=UPI00067FE0BB|nr:glycosyltransferase family 1 protein [Aestuariivita boseongensis]
MDRVELAYLRHLVQGASPCFGLVRSSLGYVLLDRAGLLALLERFDGQQPWGRADALSWGARKKGPAVRRAESDLRRLCIARALPSRLERLLRTHLPTGAQYLNVGHSNLTDRTLWAVRHDLKARIIVLIHDAIPLDYPQYQRPGTPEAFRARLKRVRHFADQIIYNSAHTQERAEHHMCQWGDPPPGVVAPLGVEVPPPDPAGLPGDIDLTQPYFVTVGTIEPRKNHALLLDAWEVLTNELPADQVPRLYICGSRGWKNEAVFARLDALSRDGPVRELPGLPDAALSALVQNARAMVFPSEAEGYGLPPIEAATLGTPVICLDLPVYRETLADIPVYLKATDRYLLANTVQSLSKGPKVEQISGSTVGFRAPTWDDHFRLALTPM